jgi:hypothetical protein
MSDPITSTIAYILLHPITLLLVAGVIYLIWWGYKKYIAGPEKP